MKRLQAETTVNNTGQAAADILKKEQRIAEIMGNIGKLLAKHGS